MTSIHKLIEARRADKEDEGGFTLIELLIVIVVLGILAAIVVFAVQNLTKESSATSCRADAKTLETAVEAFKAKNPAYPAPAVATTAGETVAVNATNFPNLVGVDKFIRSAPGATRYQIGLRTPAASPVATPTPTDGLVYVKAPANAATWVELNALSAGPTPPSGTPLDPCQNAA